MIKSVPLLALLFFAIPSSAQSTATKGSRQVVAPGNKEPKTKDAANKALGTTTFVRVLHAVPGGPKVDVFVGPVKLASNRGFTGITSYVSVKIGKTPVKVLATGTESPVIVTDTFNLKPGKHYTVALYGKRSPVLVSIDESRGKANIEKARVRVIHLAPGAPELLVTVPSERSRTGYARIASKALKYGKTGSKLTVPKTTTIQLRTVEGKIIKETKPLTFEANTRYSAFIIGEIGGSGKNALDVLVKPAGK